MVLSKRILISAYRFPLPPAFIILALYSALLASVCFWNSGEIDIDKPLRENYKRFGEWQAVAYYMANNIMN